MRIDPKSRLRRWLSKGSWAPFGGAGRDRDLELVAARIFDELPADHTSIRKWDEHGSGRMVSCLFATSGDACAPDQVFPLLRWGGQLIFVSKRHREVERAQRFFGASDEFLLETPVQCVTAADNRFGRPDTKCHYFVARKTSLTQRKQASDRHTYDVRLVPDAAAAGGFAVLKQVPTHAQAAERLARNFPKTPAIQIETAAQKLVAKVFPLFLTRETAFLKIIERRRPETFSDRFPSVLHHETDERGFVRRLTLRWLRPSGRPISQLAFARQGTELLRMLHEQVGLIHMDLRLDNFVVSEKGVGLVDFGSAVRVGEDINRNPLLRTLLVEMLAASAVQEDLRRYVDEGKVTAPLFVNCQKKLDQAVDLFTFVVQMNNPLVNPDFAGLVAYSRGSNEALLLARLTRNILQPHDPHRPVCRSAADLAAALGRLQLTPPASADPPPRTSATEPR
jgi:hypothetical protein